MGTPTPAPVPRGAYEQGKTLYNVLATLAGHLPILNRGAFFQGALDAAIDHVERSFGSQAVAQLRRAQRKGMARPARRKKGGR